MLTYFRAQPGYVEKLLPVGSKRYVSGTSQMFDGSLQIVHPDRVVDEAGLRSSAASIRLSPHRGAGAGLVAARDGAALQKLPDLPEWISPDICADADFRRSRKRCIAFTSRWK